MTNAFDASAGNPSPPTTSGESSRWMTLRRWSASSTYNSNVPMTNSGTASFRYHSVRASTLMAMFVSFGMRTGGISRMKSPALPGTTFDAAQPTRKIVPTIAEPDGDRFGAERSEHRQDYAELC